MTTHRNVMLRLTSFVLAFTFVFGLQTAVAQEAPSPAESSEEGSSGGGGDNLALAVNTKDNSSVVRFAFQVRRVMNGVVDQTNAAVAVASCEECTTIAVAIQVVMVVNNADVVTPTNLALAYNIQCTSCETLASAYQYVFSTDGAVRFTTEGWQALVDIRNQVRELLKEEPLDIVAIQAELDALMEQVSEIVATELEAAPGGTEGAAPQPESTEGAGSTGEDPATTPSPAPVEEGSSSPDPETMEEEASPSPSS